MEMPVEAPAAGTVEKIHVKEGQAVSEGDTLVTPRVSSWREDVQPPALRLRAGRTNRGSIVV